MGYGGRSNKDLLASLEFNNFSESPGSHLKVLSRGMSQFAFHFYRTMVAVKVIDFTATWGPVRRLSP